MLSHEFLRQHSLQVFYILLVFSFFCHLSWVCFAFRIFWVLGFSGFSQHFSLFVSQALRSARLGFNSFSLGRQAVRPSVNLHQKLRTSVHDPRFSPSATSFHSSWRHRTLVQASAAALPLMRSDRPRAQARLSTWLGSNSNSVHHPVLAVPSRLFPSNPGQSSAITTASPDPRSPRR